MPFRGALGARRPPSRILLLASVALLVAIWVVTWGVVRLWHAHDQIEQTRRNEMLARVIEDYVLRNIDVSALVLRSLADEIGQPGRSALALQRGLGALPQVRALAVVDHLGRVLMSSDPADVGRRIEPAALVNGDGVAVVRYLPIRSFADLDVDSSARSPVPPGIGSLPLVQETRLPDGRVVHLVALFNLDSIATFMRVTVGEESTHAVLATYDGQTLASTHTDLAAPGTPLAMSELLAQVRSRDVGTFRGPTPLSPEALAAWRAPQRWPGIVIVEHASEALAEQARTRRWALLGAALVASLLSAIGSASLIRAARARETARLVIERSERELKLVVDSVQEFLFRTDRRGILTFANDALGARGREAVGSSLAELATLPYRGHVAHLFRELPPQQTTPQARNAQVELEVAGAVRRFDLRIRPLVVQGLVQGYVGSAVDVTEQWHSARRLQSQLAFVERLIEMLPLPLSMLDEHSRYLTVNRAWMEFTGRSRAEVVGRYAGETLPPEDRALNDGMDLELLRSGGSRRYEASLHRADGSVAQVLVSKAALPSEDGSTHDRVLVAFMDISEVHQAQRAMREARDAAEEASRAKSEFIANISHELRTPLQSIIGFSEIGLMRSRGQERFVAMFDDIHRAGQRMLALVNDLLDVSKIESTVGAFHLERMDVRGPLREVIREVAPLLAQRRLRIDTFMSEQSLVVKVDPMRLQQAFRNILANAIKFSPEGGVVDVEAVVGPGHISVSVRDRGPGIPPAELEKIFEAFVQSSKTKDGAGGTGLGLAICRKIIGAMSGRIEARNHPDGGSVFVIELPTKGFADTRPAELSDA